VLKYSLSFISTESEPAMAGAHPASCYSHSHRHQRPAGLCFFGGGSAIYIYIYIYLYMYISCVCVCVCVRVCVIFCLRYLQMVNITLRLLSRPNIEKLPVIYQQLGLVRERPTQR
jgi:hypothetical protein